MHRCNRNRIIVSAREFRLFAKEPVELAHAKSDLVGYQPRAQFGITKIGAYELFDPLDHQQLIIGTCAPDGRVGKLQHAPDFRFYCLINAASLAERMMPCQDVPQGGGHISAGAERRVKAECLVRFQAGKRCRKSSPRTSNMTCRISPGKPCM